MKEISKSSPQNQNSSAVHPFHNLPDIPDLSQIDRQWMFGYRFCMIDVLDYLSKEIKLSASSPIYVGIRQYMLEMETLSAQKEFEYWERMNS